MKAGIVTTLITLCLPVSVFATTLRFSTDADLLVFDGKEVPSSLLRDADSIKLDNGPYQLAFRIEKTIHPFNSEGRLYVPSPLTASFNTQPVNQVNFRLPRLGGEREANHFDTASRPESLDGDATPIPIKLDILVITSTAETVDYEVEIERYNRSAKRASLSQFAMVTIDNSTLLSDVPELDAIPPQSQVPTGQRLRCWLKLADPQTRSTFL